MKQKVISLITVVLLFVSALLFIGAVTQQDDVTTFKGQRYVFSGSYRENYNVFDTQTGKLYVLVGTVNAGERVVITDLINQTEKVFRLKLGDK